MKMLSGLLFLSIALFHSTSAHAEENHLDTAKKSARTVNDSPANRGISLTDEQVWRALLAKESPALEADPNFEPIAAKFFLAATSTPTQLGSLWSTIQAIQIPALEHRDVSPAQQIAAVQTLVGKLWLNSQAKIPGLKLPGLNQPTAFESTTWDRVVGTALCNLARHATNKAEADPSASVLAALKISGPPDAQHNALWQIALAAKVLERDEKLKLAQTIGNSALQLLTTPKPPPFNRVAFILSVADGDLRSVHDAGTPPVPPATTNEAAEKTIRDFRERAAEFVSSPTEFRPSPPPATPLLPPPPPGPPPDKIPDDKKDPPKPDVPANGGDGSGNGHSTGGDFVPSPNGGPVPGGLGQPQPPPISDGGGDNGGGGVRGGPCGGGGGGPGMGPCQGGGGKRCRAPRGRSCKRRRKGGLFGGAMRVLFGKLQD